MFEWNLYFLYLYVPTVMIKNMVWKESVQVLHAHTESYRILVFFDVGIMYYNNHNLAFCYPRN